MNKKEPATAPDLTRPTVEVKIPNVKLQLKDLAFLRSVANPEGVKCNVGRNVEDRLLLLDLIAWAKRPVGDKIVAESVQKIFALKESLTAAIINEDWQRVSQIAYSLKHEKDQMSPRDALLLTKKGEELLAHGVVSVRVRKVGCV